MTMPASLPADIEAIIFDCDGTLADTFGAHFRAFRDILSDYQVAFDAEFYHTRLGLSRYQLLEDLKQAHGNPFDEQAVADRNTAAFLKHLSAIRPIPYTHDILRSQYGQLRMGVASGGQRPIVEATLKTIGVYDMLDTLVTIEDTGVGKPAPDLYLLAAERLEIAPRFVLTYEDSNEGMEAAERAGMRVIDIRPFYRTDPARW